MSDKKEYVVKSYAMVEIPVTLTVTYEGEDEGFDIVRATPGAYRGGEEQIKEWIINDRFAYDEILDRLEELGAGKGDVEDDC